MQEDKRTMTASKQSSQTGPGSRFGHLTVVSDSGLRKNGYIVWNLRCDCGNELQVDIRTLRRGTVTDCGCITKVGSGQRDVTGERFGMLTARYSTGRKDSGGSYIWHCTCDCGGEIDASLHQLQAGYRKSCGCLSHTQLQDLTGKRFGRLTVVRYAGKWEGKHRWQCLCDCGQECTVTHYNLLSNKTRSCGCLKQDTARENLKLVKGTSVSVLERNAARLYSTNTSGHTGVYQNKKTGKWIAEMIFQGRMYYLGCYTDKEDAVKARHRGEEMQTDFLVWYYKEFGTDQTQAKCDEADIQKSIKNHNL
ncbi:MAG: transcriptional regulator [Lachnospiraceae bacterium]|nr:transcriptional regulator [Lachnospiraceae bacterium]